MNTIKILPTPITNGNSRKIIKYICTRRCITISMAPHWQHSVKESRAVIRKIVGVLVNVEVRS